MACLPTYKGKRFSSLAKLQANILHTSNDNTSFQAINIDPVANTMILNNMVGLLKQSFPNIKVVVTDNNHPIFVRYPDTKGLINDGVVYINSTFADVTTPVHEILGHVVIEYIQANHPIVFNRIKNNILEELKNGEYEWLQMNKGDYYSSLPEIDQVKEVFSRVVGITGAERLEAVAQKYGKTPQQKGFIKQFISDMINLFRNYMQRMFGKMPGGKGIAIGDDTSLVDILEQIYERIESGDVVMESSSDQVFHMMNMNESRMAFAKLSTPSPTADNVQDLMNLMMNPMSKRSFAEMTMDEKINIGYPVFARVGKITDKDSNEILFTGNEAVDKAVLRRFYERLYGNNDEFYKWLDKYLSTDDVGRKEMKKGKYYTDTKNRWIRDKITKIDQVIHPSSGKVIMRYKDAHKLGLIIDPLFQALNPYIVVETAVNKAVTTVSLFDINMLIGSHTHIKKEKVMKLYGNDSLMDKKGDLMNNYRDTRSMGMYLLAQKFKHDNPTVDILDVGLFFLSEGKEGRYVHLDYSKMRRAQRELYQVTNFKNMLGSGVIKNLFEKPVDVGDTNYEKLLMDFYAQSNVLKFTEERDNHVNIWKYYHSYRTPGDALTTQEKKVILRMRLKYLEGLGSDDKLTEQQRREKIFLPKALISLSSDYLYQEEGNDTADVDKMKAWIAPSHDIGFDLYQSLRKEILAAKYLSVAETKEFQNEFETIAKKMRAEVTGSSSKSFQEFIRDMGNSYFDKLFVKKTIGGKQVHTGYIYWTTNTKLDPLHAVEAASKLSNGELTTEMLAVGEYIVNKVHENMIDMFYHVNVNKGGKYGGEYVKNDKGEIVKYTRDMAEAEMMSRGESGRSYRKGMIPLMYRSSGDYMSRGMVKEGVKKSWLQVSNIYGPMEEAMDLQREADKENYSLDDVFGRQFYRSKTGMNQITGEHDSDYGNVMRLEMLGLDFDVSTGQWLLKDADRSDMISTNLWNIMSTMVLNTRRKINYETNVMPMVNAVNLVMSDLKNKSIDLGDVESMINDVVYYVIKGKPMRNEGDVLGISAERASLVISSAAGSYMMFANANVAILSAIANSMAAWIEAMGNIGYDEGYYGPKDLLKASAAYFHEYHKAEAINELYQIMNMEEQSLLNNPVHKPFSSHPFTRHFSNIGNYATDKYARVVVVIAHMMKMGTWDAHVYNKTTGKIEYDQNLDKSFEGDKGKAFLKFMIQKHKEQGILEPDAKRLKQRYDLNEIGRLKYIGNKYIVGAYGATERNRLSTHFLGRLAQMFQVYLMSRLQNAFQKGEEIIEGGWWKTELIDGTYITHWEKRFVEGYFRTAFQVWLPDTFNAIKNKEKLNASWHRLNSAQKYNMRKSLYTFGTFILVMLIGAALKEWDPEEKEKEKRKKGDNVFSIQNGDVFEDYRILRNFKYAYHDLWVLGSVAAWVDRPFAFVDILGKTYRAIFTNSYDTVFERLVAGTGGAGSTIRTFNEIL